MKRWHKIVLGVVAILLGLGGFGYWFVGQIYLRVPEVTVTADMMAERHDPRALRNDIDVMLETMEEVHPDLYAYTPRDVIMAGAETIKQNINEPLTRLEFYRIASPLNALFIDGHTELKFPTAEWNAYKQAGGTVFPHNVRLEEGRIFLAGDVTAGPLPDGTEILAINGIPASDITATLLAGISGENPNLKARFVERGFPRYLWGHYGFQGPFDIDIQTPASELASINLDGTTEETIAQPDETESSEDWVQLDFLVDETVAYLDVNSFDVRLRPFRERLLDLFDIIDTRNAGHLIIDLRGNGGGDSLAGDTLLTFISGILPEQTEKLDFKASTEIKDFYKRLFPAGFRWISPGLLHPLFARLYDTPDGQSFTYEFGGPRASPEREDRFTGPVTLLIDERSYSAATMFAAAFKALDRGTVIGRETGEPMIFYGDNYYLFLPATQLEATVSHKRFYLPGAESEDRGVMPDIMTPDSDAALAAALDRISGSQ